MHVSVHVSVAKLKAALKPFARVFRGSTVEHMRVDFLPEQGQVRLIASNGVMNFTSGLDADVPESASVAISHERCARIVEKLEGETVELIYDGDYLRFRGKSFELRVHTIGGDALALVNAFHGMDVCARVELAGKKLVEAINLVSFAASDDDARAYLKGVYIHSVSVDGGSGADRLRWVATDGRVMAYSDLDVSGLDTEFEGVIMPTLAGRVVESMIGGQDDVVVLEILKGAVRVITSDRELVTLCQNGSYPDYRRVIPHLRGPDRLHFTFSASQLCGAVKRVATIGKGAASVPVQIDVDGSSLSIMSNSPDNGAASEVVDASPVSVSDRHTTAFNGPLLGAILDKFQDASVSFEQGDVMSPAVFRSDDIPNYRVVAMPMRS